MKNLVASIQDRLKNFSRKEGVVLNLVLEDYANARLFARLSTSRYRDEFILKGAQLFKLWSDTPHRPTRDADFLSLGSPDPEVLKSTFEEICGVATTPPDGLEWTVGQAAPIREDNLYGGVRIKLTAHLGNMRIPAQIDVGFGDAITPKAEYLAPSTWHLALEKHIDDGRVLSLLADYMQRVIYDGGWYRDAGRGISLGCPLATFQAASFCTA